MDRIEEIREAWEKAYKGLIKNLGNGITYEDVACMFFELGWRAADESTIDKSCNWIENYVENAFTEVNGMMIELHGKELSEDFRKAMEE